MRDDDRFDDVYDEKFDIEAEEAEIEIDGVTPGDSRVLDELVEGVDAEDVDIESLVDVGLNYMEINRFEQAINTFERAIRFDEDNQDAWVNKGFAHAEMEEYDEAIGAYREALRIDDSTPEAAKALTNLAFAEYEMGRSTDVVEYLDRALDIDERLPEAWYNRGFFLNENGRYEAALNSINNAIRLGYRNPVVLEEKARALEGLERYQEAEEVREQAQSTRDEEVRDMMRESDEQNGRWRQRE